MFEELEEMGVRVLEEDKYEKWFACYDFEAYQWDFREGIDQVEEIESEKGMSWNKVHVLVSFSVGCNLEGVEMCHVSSKDSEELTAKLVGTLLEMAHKKYRAAVEHYEYIFEQLEQLKVQEMVCLQGDIVDDDDDLEMNENGGDTSKHMKLLENLYGKFKGIVKNWQCLDLFLLVMTCNSSRSFCLKNCMNAGSNLISLSKRLESIHASRLNT